MADDTNIDEILKSIDALLKEGGPEKGLDEGAGDQSSKTRGDIATNDDEVSDSEIPDATVSIGSAEDDADGPAVEAIDQGADEHPEAEEAETDEQQLDEDVQAEDTSEIDALSGQTLGQEHEVKRIVLSESMVIEDTPDLPLEVAGTETAIEDDQPENRMLGEVYSDEPAPDHVAGNDLPENEDESSAESSGSKDISSPEVQENEDKDEPSVDTSELDMGDLVEQITSEISARLQQQLPGMVAGMVAEAMQKNLAARAAADDESTDDTQN